MVTVSGVVVQLLGWMLAIKMIFLLSFLLNPANSSSIWKTCEDVSDPVACFCHTCDIFITVTDVIKSSKVFSYNFQSFLYKRQSTQVICQSSCRCKILLVAHYMCGHFPLHTACRKRVKTRCRCLMVAEITK